MISMTIQTKKYGDLGKFADNELIKMSARITSLWGESLANYIRETQLSGQVLNIITGETRASMGFYKLKKNKKATMVVRPGKNVKGHLNYLAGMQRGMLAGRGRKVIIRPKPFMKPGFRAWRATGEARRIKEEVFKAYLEHSFSSGGSA